MTGLQRWSMGTWSVCLTVARHQSRDSGSQNRVILPQRIIIGSGGGGGGLRKESGMPDLVCHLTPPHRPPPGPRASSSPMSSVCPCPASGKRLHQHQPRLLRHVSNVNPKTVSNISADRKPPAPRQQGGLWGRRPRRSSEA